MKNIERGSEGHSPLKIFLYVNEKGHIDYTRWSSILLELFIFYEYIEPYKENGIDVWPQEEGTIMEIFCYSEPMVSFDFESDGKSVLIDNIKRFRKELPPKIKRQYSIERIYKNYTNMIEK